MSRTIDSVTISSIEDRRLVLENAHAARYMTIGTNWNVLRIIMRVAFDDSGGNLIGSPRFGYGVMTSPSPSLANGVLTATTSHFAGIATGTSGPTWTRATSPIIHYSTSMFATKKVLNTYTIGAGGAALLSAAPSSVRVAVVGQITKGSPNFSFTQVTVQGTAGLVDLPKSALVPALEVASMTDVITSLNAAIGGAGTRYGQNTFTVAVSEATNGYFDALTFFWDRTTPALRVSDIYFAKIS